MALSDLLGRSANQPDDTRLEELCDTVTRGLSNFAKVGEALAEIRDKQLYRNHAGTFEAFCRDRWDMTAQHAGRLMSAAAICRQLEPTGFVPQNERQARQLGTLDPDTRQDAWDEAIESADEKGIVPAKAVTAAVTKRQPKSKSKKLRPTRLRVPGATVVIEPNRRFSSVVATLEHALDEARRREATQISRAA